MAPTVVSALMLPRDLHLSISCRKFFSFRFFFCRSLSVNPTSV